MTAQRPCVVAIPAMNEAERIRACLCAVLDQHPVFGGLPPQPAVVVFANNCTDDTAAIARAFGPAVHVVEAHLPSEQANAGVARRRAMDLGAERLADRADGLICTTDADSRPRRDWLARLCDGIDSGAAAVAGAVEFDPEEQPSGGFGALRQAEARYSALQAEITARADPEPHNPWPNHLWAWGANLAVTVEAYRHVGGLPEAPLAEDRAFVERLKLFDIPVRHCLDARVWTSSRRNGRAPGGLASLIDDHLGANLAACDAALEPAAEAWRRAKAHVRLRNCYTRGRAGARDARALRLSAISLAEALDEPTFGRAWDRVERASPVLARRRLSPAELPREIATAQRILSRLVLGGTDDRSDNTRAASAGLWSGPGPPP